jgi:hypothetical protein
VNPTLKKILLAMLAGAVSGTGLAETPKNAASKPVPPPAPERSVFIIPTNAREGRDPFFPESARPYEAAVQANQNHKVEPTALVIKGFSGTPGHRFVIINNHTFAPGDEGDVLTNNGRAHIRCVEIRNNVVVVEINGQRHEIPYLSK